MTRKGDWIQIIKENDYALPIGETYLVKSGADIDGQLLIWLPDGSEAVLNWNEYRAARQTI